MKGIIFNVVEEVVEETFGLAAWDQIVARAGVDGAYTSLGSYPDDEVAALVASAAEVAGTTEHDVLVLVGRRGFAKLAGRHSYLLDSMESWRAVLDQLDGIIHPEVRKIYPDAQVPSFQAEADSDEIVLEYRSKRSLCALAEGLALGLGDWFGAELDIRHDTCVRRGDDVCSLRVVEL